MVPVEVSLGTAEETSCDILGAGEAVVEPAAMDDVVVVVTRIVGGVLNGAVGLAGVGSGVGGKLIVGLTPGGFGLGVGLGVSSPSGSIATSSLSGSIVTSSLSGPIVAVATSSLSSGTTVVAITSSLSTTMVSSAGTPDPTAAMPLLLLTPFICFSILDLLAFGFFIFIMDSDPLESLEALDPLDALEALASLRTELPPALLFEPFVLEDESLDDDGDDLDSFDIDDGELPLTPELLEL